MSGDVREQAMNQPSEHLNPSDISGTWEPGRPRQGSTFDKIKTTVAEKLHTAAEALHEKTSRQTGGAESRGGNDSLSGYGRQAAEWLDRSADTSKRWIPSRSRPISRIKCA